MITFSPLQNATPPSTIIFEDGQRLGILVGNKWAPDKPQIRQLSDYDLQRFLSIACDQGAREKKEVGMLEATKRKLADALQEVVKLSLENKRLKETSR